MRVILCLAAAAGSWLYVRYRWRLWKATRDARRAIVAGQAAKEREAARRTLTQCLHAVLPEAGTGPAVPLDA